MRTRTHVIDAYAEDVIRGRVPAGKYHRLACERHQFDRRREGTRAFPYRLDLDLADRFLRFGECLKHYKAEWAGQFMQWQPHQAFRLGSIIGWVHVVTGLRRFRNSYNELPRKNGKALAIDTPVPTPRGWTAHGDLHAGDTVFGPDGQPIRVEWVGPVQSGPCYRLTLSTGETLIAHAAHEWITERTWYTGRQKGSRAPLPPVETQHIAATLRAGARGDFVHRIIVAGALQLPPARLPIPPYTFGAWLGDGTSRSGAITVADRGIIDRIRAEGVTVRPVPSAQRGAAALYRLNPGQGSRSSFTNQLRLLNVLGDKRIPLRYLRASYAQRLEVLRGIVDTDGYVDPRGIYEVVTVSSRLADDYRELVHSLGLKSTLTIDRARLNGRDCGPRYRLHFSAHQDHVAALPRKQTAWAPTQRRRSRARTIVACEPCDAMPVNCIQVEGGVYLAGTAMVPTHNSLEDAIVALYITFFDGEPGAEGYTAATKREQAKIVWNDCKRLVRSSGLRSRITVLQSNLHRDGAAQKLEPLGADVDSLDGLNAHFISLDELAKYKQRDVIDVLETATSARRQPLIFKITTAGSDPVSPGGDEHNYACQILERTLVDETYFAFIAHADPEDDWTLEATARKANPNYGVSVKPEDLKDKVRKAIGMPSAAAAYKQKHLNLWVNALLPWLSLDGWRAGQTTGWTIDDVAGEACVVGIDLASKLDLCAMMALFPPTAARPRWAVLRWVWTPADTLADRAHRDRAPYPVWVEQGHLIAVPGTTVNHQLIREALTRLRSQATILRVGFDPWHADQLVRQLTTEDGFDVEQILEVSQTFAGMSSGCKAMEAEVLAGQVDAGGDPVVEWAAGNAVVKRDDKDNVLPAKRKSRGRIDPIVALAIAWNLQLRLVPEQTAEDPDLVVA